MKKLRKQVASQLKKLLLPDNPLLSTVVDLEAPINGHGCGISEHTAQLTKLLKKT